MRRAAILLSALIMSGCGSSNVSDKSESTEVGGSWKRSTDDMTDEKGFISYGETAITSSNSAIGIGCSHGGDITLSINLEGNRNDGGRQMLLPLLVRLDDEPAFSQMFIVPPESSSIVPGEGTPEDTIKFIDRVKGHHIIKLAVDGSMLDEANSPSVSFDGTGIEDIIPHLRPYCHTAVASAPPAAANQDTPQEATPAPAAPAASAPPVQEADATASSSEPSQPADDGSDHVPFASLLPGRWAAEGEKCGDPTNFVFTDANYQHGNTGGSYTFQKLQIVMQSTQGQSVGQVTPGEVGKINIAWKDWKSINYIKCN